MKTLVSILILAVLAGFALTGCQNVYVTFAKVYLQQNDLEKAREQLMLGLEENANDAQAHYLLGDIYAQQKKYPEMLAEFEAASALSPKYNPDIETTKNKIFKNLYNDAVDVFNKQKPAEAAELLKVAVTIQPKERSGWSLLSKSYINEKKYGDAINSLNKVVEA